MGKSTISGPFPIATLNYQRVYNPIKQLSRISSLCRSQPALAGLRATRWSRAKVGDGKMSRSGKIPEAVWWMILIYTYIYIYTYTRWLIDLGVFMISKYVDITSSIYFDHMLMFSLIVYIRTHFCGQYFVTNIPCSMGRMLNVDKDAEGVCFRVRGGATLSLPYVSNNSNNCSLLTKHEACLVFLHMELFIFGRTHHLNQIYTPRCRKQRHGFVWNWDIPNRSQKLNGFMMSFPRMAVA